MNYSEFLETKKRKIVKSGFDIDVKELNPMLFDFQKFTIKRALKAGKYAIFADTGQGKTPMQLEIAYRVNKETNMPVLILAPLAVTSQTIREGKKFNINVSEWNIINDNNIQITNYEQLKNIDVSKFGCIILDESSILKNETGKYRNLLIDSFSNTPYKYCFSATPSPNDPMELGNHSEFLDVMKYNEMLAMFFVHDSQSTQKWRLKGHAIERFYEFVASWAIMYGHPKDIGFNQGGFDLPKLTIIEKQVKTKVPEGHLFGGLAVNATDFNQALRETETERIEQTLNIIKGIPEDESIIVWAKHNKEASNLKKEFDKLGISCRNVQGSDSEDKKKRDLLGFPDKEFRILITKQEIASQGLNYQHCCYQIFNSVDFSFEKAYQAMRRSWRFGQKREVFVYMVTTDRMINVVKTQKQKEIQFENMKTEMTKAVNKHLNNSIMKTVDNSEDIKTDDYHLMKGDCVQRSRELKDNSADLIVFSPPFADLYTYSDYVEDMGNVSDYDEFVKHFGYLVKELKRIIKPGRIIAVHSMNLPTLKSRDGYIGIRRFNSMIGDMFESEGMFLHSEFTIWKDPLLAAVRTKTIGLAHKQLMKDSSIIRAGIPDVVQCFKTKEDNQVPIEHELLDSYIPMHEFDKFPVSVKGFNEYWGYDPESKYSLEEQYSHHVWQRYASPIWMDISQTNVLQYTTARGQNDEKHICPLQLDVIKRIIMLYSNKGETVLSPFGGIGSEGYQALMMNRKSISIELKDSYFNINVKNHRNAIEKKGQLQMF
jgi:DNA modification methylase/superfamily II DNA or RNA helicase